MPNLNGDSLIIPPACTRKTARGGACIELLKSVEAGAKRLRTYMPEAGALLENLTVATRDLAERVQALEIDSHPPEPESGEVD